MSFEFSDLALYDPQLVKPPVSANSKLSQKTKNVQKLIERRDSWFGRKADLAENDLGKRLGQVWPSSAGGNAWVVFKVRCQPGRDDDDLLRGSNLA